MADGINSYDILTIVIYNFPLIYLSVIKFFPAK